MRPFLWALLTACPGTLDRPERFTTASLAFTCDAAVDVKKDILQMKCATAGCHTAATSAGDLDLESDDVALRLYGQDASFCPGHLLLETVNPFGGYLFDKVTLAKPACGTRMPQTGPALTDAERDCLHLYMAKELEKAAAEQNKR